MRKATVLIGKLARGVARFRGGGSALPGLVVEKIDPNFLPDVLANLPLGTVVISGTNGKTTTTKIVVELLESHGLKVFTNRTGSNFTRGVISAMLGEIRGFRLDADIAVLELDEAHALPFIKLVKPTYALLLNVLRDQLDRFGEIDKTAKLLTTVAQSASKGVVLNRDDPLIAAIADTIKVKARYFGYHPKLASKFPSDEELYGQIAERPTKIKVKTDVELESFSGSKVTYKIEQKMYSTTLLLGGVHNMLNAAAALSLARLIIGKSADNQTLIQALAKVRPAFGRGESLSLNGQKLELILVKNPSGFRSSLLSQLNHQSALMIAINDHYADGRDMSWLWDVDFSALKQVEVVSGVRAYDMALRLKYDDVIFTTVESDLKKALTQFLAANPSRPKQIFCTYTAMLALRKLLSKLTPVEEVL